MLSLHALRMRRLLEAYLDDELGVVERSDVASHVRACWYCSGVVEVGLAIRAALLKQGDTPHLTRARLMRFSRSLGT